ncbi:sensor histidine kinase [Aquamicrobium ahrensii]|uniref:histidine kinase n=1 Tax=Aquamicrobium ahrensii TaxID=469551 RepID=A0ABV2KRH3_9HYPH
MPDAVATGCERLVHGCVTEKTARARHARFIGVMLAAPFLAAGSAVMLVTASLGASATLATILAIFGVCWLAALLVSASGRHVESGTAILAISALAIGALVAFSGGLASPAALLLAAPVVEAFWVSRSRRWALAGAAAAIAGALMQFLPGEAALPAYVQPAPWHWLLPLAWGATLVPRWAGFRHDGDVKMETAADLDVEGLTSAVLLRINRQGDVLDAGERTNAVLGLAPHLLLGNALFDRIHIADRISYLNALADMRDGAISASVEMRVRLPKATDESTSSHKPFMFELARGDEEGNAFLALLRDNSEVAELRQALCEAQESAASAEVTKSRFLAAVSHELRTPLNAIIGFSDMLLHEMFGPFNDPRQKEYVTLVRDSGQHLLEVVTSILDVSRIEAGAYRTNPEPFRFAEAAEMCRAMMQLQAETRKIRLEMRVAADTGEVNADRRAIQQILINLASNAIKFTPEGGEVAIGARRVGSRLHFWVSDTGIGIAEEDLAQIGHPFVQVQNDYTRGFEGAGLGLSLVKGLVSLHEGAMSIDSMPGEGTTVSVSIPVDGPKADKDRLVVLADATPAGRKNEEVHGSLRKTG